MYILKYHIWERTPEMMEMRRQGHHDYQICVACGLVKKKDRTTFKEELQRDPKNNFEGHSLPDEACMVTPEKVSELRKNLVPFTAMHRLLCVETYDDIPAMERKLVPDPYGAEYVYCPDAARTIKTEKQ